MNEHEAKQIQQEANIHGYGQLLVELTQVTDMRPYKHWLTNLIKTKASWQVVQ